MDQKRKEVSIQLRDLIIQDWKGDENGKLSIHGIAKKFKIPKSRVQHIILHYK